PSRLIQPPRSNPSPMAKHPPEVGLLDRMLPVRLSSPISDGACPTVHRSTANPDIANRKRRTLPRSLSVHQRGIIRS
ncbi:hypothetical protein K443DRAFT_60213, partial [Laccaria amethystina LaAM-08-1]